MKITIGIIAGIVLEKSAADALEISSSLKIRNRQFCQRKANWPRRKIWGRLPRPIHLPENLSLDVDFRYVYRYYPVLGKYFSLQNFCGAQISRHIALRDV